VEGNSQGLIKLLLQQSPGSAGENYENRSDDCWCPGRDSDLVSLKYKSQDLPLVTKSSLISISTARLQ